MPLYRYEALDRTGNKVAGAKQVPDERALTSWLWSMGYQPLSIQVSARGITPPAWPGTQPAPAGPIYSTSAGERAVARMYQQLYLSFRAGMPAYQALSTVAVQVPDRGLREALSRMAQEIGEGGSTLSAQMARYPRIFGRGDVGLLRAAEEGGFLPEALEMLSSRYEQDEAARRRMMVWVWMFHANALMLPAFIAVLAFFPALVKTGRWQDGVVAMGHAFLVFGLPMLAAYIGLLMALPRMRRSHRFEMLWHRLMLRLPVIGKINFLRSNAVFLRVLQLLARGGAMAQTCWETAAAAVPNRFFAEKYGRAMPAVAATGRFSDGLQQAGMLDPADVGSVATGENTGEVPQALGYLADRYEEETKIALGSSVVRGAITMVLWMVILFGIGCIGVALTYKSVVGTLTGWGE